MTQELTVIARAKVALESSATTVWLRGLASEFAVITAITNKAGRDECHAAYMELKGARLEVEAVSKEARTDAMAFGKACIAEEGELVSIVAPEEARLKALRDAWDAEEARKRELIAAAERARITNILGIMSGMRNSVGVVAGRSSEVVRQQITAVGEIVIDDSFGEYQADAADAKYEALARLREIHAEKLSAEIESDRMKAEQEAETEMLRAERAAAQAELKALAAERAALARQKKVMEDAQAERDRDRQEAREYEDRKLAAACVPSIPIHETQPDLRVSDETQAPPAICWQDVIDALQGAGRSDLAEFVLFKKGRT